jgi:hypothetical protein
MHRAEFRILALTSGGNHALIVVVTYWCAAGCYRKEAAMAKNAKRTVWLNMDVTVRGEDRLISEVRINGKRIPEKAVLALAATLQRHHLREGASGRKTASTTRSDLHLNAEYERAPWGYLGMTVHIYRPIVKGPARMTRLYTMRSLNGVIATAGTMDALSDLARREHWVARYRHVDADGHEVWVTVPE